MGRGVKATPQLFAVFFSLSDIREALKKNHGIIWEFFPNVGPPPPLLGISTIFYRNFLVKLEIFG